MAKQKLSVEKQKSSLAETAGKVIPVRNMKLEEVVDHAKLFQILLEVEKNIENTLTDPDKTRTITIKIAIEPDDERSGAAFSSSIDFKPCAIKGGQSVFVQFGKTLFDKEDNKKG